MSRKHSPHVTGREIREWTKWLLKHQEGCCHKVLRHADHNVLCVCVGWRQYEDFGGSSEVVESNTSNPMGRRVGWNVVAMLGFQSDDNCMQTDLDVDFKMPWNTQGYCDEMNAKLTPEEKRRGDRYVPGDVWDTSEELCSENGPLPSLHECARVAKYLNRNIHGVFRALKDLEERGEA